MKKFTNQFNGSHADRINNGGGRFRRIALFPLMLLMLLLVPTSMVAQTDYDNTVTFTALEGNPLGISDAESYHKLFDGKKKAIPPSGAAISMAVPMSSSKPARQEFLWATLSLQATTTPIGMVVTLSRGNSMETMKAKMENGRSFRR